ncbi:MAG: hypothetical protein GX434_17170 [Peptococcaceae bacterium]|nr:hypothetical protein [Peptococcaceae bacterium]
MQDYIQRYHFLFFHEHPVDMLNKIYKTTPNDFLKGRETNMAEDDKTCQKKVFKEQLAVMKDKKIEIELFIIIVLLFALIIKEYNKKNNGNTNSSSNTNRNSNTNNNINTITINIIKNPY